MPQDRAGCRASLSRVRLRRSASKANHGISDFPVWGAISASSHSCDALFTQHQLKSRPSNSCSLKFPIAYCITGSVERTVEQCRRAEVNSNLSVRSRKPRFGLVWFGLDWIGGLFLLRESRAPTKGSQECPPCGRRSCFQRFLDWARYPENSRPDPGDTCAA